MSFFIFFNTTNTGIPTSIVSVFINKHRDFLHTHTWHRSLKCLLKLYRALFSREKLFTKAESISDSPKNLPLKYFPPILEYPPRACRLLIGDTGRPFEVALYARHIDRTNMIAAFVRSERGGGDRRTRGTTEGEEARLRYDICTVIRRR